jgi:hypothetical protein
MSVTVPAAAVRAPPSPPASPTAVTSSPTATPLSSVATVVRPDASSSCSNGDVPLRVGAEHLGVVRLPGAYDGHRDRRGALDHVVVGDDEPVAPDHDAPPGRLTGTELHLAGDGPADRSSVASVVSRGAAVECGGTYPYGGRPRSTSTRARRGRTDGGDGQGQDEGGGGRGGEGALHADRDRHDPTVGPPLVGGL